MNDMYAKDISKKIKSVKRDKQRKGLFIGGKPVYGYKMHPTEKNKIVIDEEVAPVVRRIFALALSGMSCRQIAALLNQDSVPTPSAYAHLSIAKPGAYSGLWSGERISEMLQNETYIGNMVQGRRVKISYKSKKCLSRSPEHWVIVEGTHEPIIDSETFQKVQVLLNSRRHTRNRTYDFALKGLIFCHECGHPLSVINRKNAKVTMCCTLSAVRISATPAPESVPAIPFRNKRSHAQFLPKYRNSARLPCSPMRYSHCIQSSTKSAGKHRAPIRAARHRIQARYPDGKSGSNI